MMSPCRSRCGGEDSFSWSSERNSSRLESLRKVRAKPSLSQTFNSLPSWEQKETIIDSNIYIHTSPCVSLSDIFLMKLVAQAQLYEGHSKSSKTNSKKYFIYEIYKIIFLHSFHPIHNKRCFHRKIPGWNFSMETSLVMNWMESM